VNPPLLVSFDEERRNLAQAFAAEGFGEASQTFPVGPGRPRFFAGCRPGLELLPGLVEGQVLGLLPDAGLALEDGGVSLASSPATVRLMFLPV
jgi:hypothetical protein